MIACVDVDYREKGAVAACVLFRAWTDAASAGQVVEHLDHVEPYQPGQFYRRELPCLLAVLGKVSDPIDLVVIDGYVWLGDEQRPGLGGHLYDALGRRFPVVGVAKTRYPPAILAREVRRGTSNRPLYVTAVGIDVEEVCRQVQDMQGPFRIPTLLKEVDQLCRQSR